MFLYSLRFTMLITMIPTRPQNIPENWGPLVTKKLQFNTDIALFNQDQWNEISIYQCIRISHNTNKNVSLY